MGYSGCKIAGHSGTDFKHRQGFVRRKENLQHRQRLGGEKAFNKTKFQLQKQAVQRTSYRFQKSWSTQLFRWVSFAIITGAFGYFLFILHQHRDYFLIESPTWSNPTHVTLVNHHVRFKSADHENAYRLAMLYGDAHFQQGHLYEAQVEIHRALKIVPTDAKANWLMTQILVQRCVTTYEVCAEAEAYLDVLYRNPAVDTDKKVFLQNLYLHHRNN